MAVLSWSSTLFLDFRRGSGRLGRYTIPGGVCFLTYPRLSKEALSAGFSFSLSLSCFLPSSQFTPTPFFFFSFNIRATQLELKLSSPISNIARSSSSGGGGRGWTGGSTPPPPAFYVLGLGLGRPSRPSCRPPRARLWSSSSTRVGCLVLSCCSPVCAPVVLF